VSAMTVTSDEDAEAAVVDPALYQRPDIRSVLAVRDIGSLYRVLREVGLSQRRIARLTGQSQSEVSEILGGRQVSAYEVLDRIVMGLGIPRELMGMSWWAPDGTYCGEVTIADPPEGVEEMRRRGLLAAGAVAAVGWPLLGDVRELPAPAAEPLPSQLGMVHVESVTDLLTRLRAWARTYGGQAEVIGAAAERSMQLMTVPGDDAIHARLGSVLAELHTEAGWTYFDSGADDMARHYFSRAMEIARRIGDPYQVAYALRHAGMLPLEREQPNDALKLFQLGQMTFMLSHRRVSSDDPRVPSMIACLDSLQARALARMDRPDLARSKLAAARTGWQPPDTFAQADADYRNAEVSLLLGQLDTAEQFITVSSRAWNKQDRRPAASTAILRATIHVQAGEQDGQQLARNAITAVTKLSSVRVRRRLEPLAAALEARPSSDTKELARMARR
jgi:transcriptional regulator with XRE-family HTH domain/tetratricopeptide (TPR) repeat protein